jgi:benzodiazapine receptor
MRLHHKLIKNLYVRHFFTFLLFLAIVFLIQFLGSIQGHGDFSSWYSSLERPNWESSEFVVGPVWIVLYFLIAGAGYFLWISPKSKKRASALLIWILQLFFNALWPFLFFTMQNPMLAALDLTLVVVLVLLFLVRSYSVNRAATIAFFPYLLWLLYAVVLNWAIISLNP